MTQLIIDTLVKSGTVGTPELFSKLTKLLGRIRPDNIQRGDIINSALKWSKSVSKQSGHPGLHECIANMFWRGKALRTCLSIIIFNKILQELFFCHLKPNFILNFSSVFLSFKAKEDNILNEMGCFYVDPNFPKRYHIIFKK